MRRERGSLGTGVGAAIALASSLAVGCGHHRGSNEAPDPGDAGDGGGLADVAPTLPEDAAPGREPDAGPPIEAGPFAVDAAPPTATCAPGADLVYVATEERNLYSFDPAHVSFSLLGNIDCAQGSYVNSMAIDRNAVAWINYGDGSLWSSNTQQPACVATGFLPNQQGVGLFGMGFAAKTPGGDDDLLFIDDLSGGGLGFIDQTTMTLMRLGPFGGALANRDCELTGRSDARLFGFFTGGPYGDAGAASVAELDPQTVAATSEWNLPGVDTGSDWAFAAWGGDFYLFTADKYDMTDPFTTVTRFSPTDGSLTVLATDIGFRVVGAGSSTCAPTTRPTQ
jgi:hypothetical protein